VCIECGELEKLRANLLDIRQEHVTWEQESSAQSDLHEGQGRVETSQDVFRRMQNQLNDCIRHHQHILRCVTFETSYVNKNHVSYVTVFLWQFIPD
jgi:hypothetical protein